MTNPDNDPRFKPFTTEFREADGLWHVIDRRTDTAYDAWSKSDDAEMDCVMRNHIHTQSLAWQRISDKLAALGVTGEDVEKLRYELLNEGVYASISLPERYFKDKPKEEPKELPQEEPQEEPTH